MFCKGGSDHFNYSCPDLINMYKQNMKLDKKKYAIQIAFIKCSNAIELTDCKNRDYMSSVVMLLHLLCSLFFISSSVSRHICHRQVPPLIMRL